MSQNKRMNGQYFTITNPFNTVAFYKWCEEHEEEFRNAIIVEPFAGANNIPRMISDANILTNSWESFDIEPAHNKMSQFPIKQQDTIANFPGHYTLCITNPPYLSKNSATRRGLAYPNTQYDDLYKLCLEVMLQHVDYVAAIIPETFITSGLFTARLKYFVSLTCKMFDDTDCPVCLALFDKESTDDFMVYQMNEKIGLYSTLCKGLVRPAVYHTWTINDPAGSVGIKCCDNTKEPSIEFCEGSSIAANKIKVSSRAITRVSGLPDNVNLNEFLAACNRILKKYRLETHDVFMASFKGLRSDEKYRRRLDFATAKDIMSQALLEVTHASH